jgi:tetratricopeptide (TPR) repeat protein
MSHAIRALAFLSCALLGPPVGGAGRAAVQDSTPRQKQEAAYRENNLGVAYLEQYDFESAAESFRRALAQDPGLELARLNLGIALFYAGKVDAAKQDLELARKALPDRPHPDYVLGLIARAADRPNEALDAFTRARTLDPTDPGTAINLGQLYLQQRKYQEAIDAFRAATAAEPYNATAAYGLATALIRSGAAAEGKPAMAIFEKLRESSYATTFSQNYLEQGRYAEAIASTGSEADLVDERVPDVEFTDVTRSVMPAQAAAALARPLGAVALFDLDNDGDLDLADGAEPSPHLYRNDSGRFTDITATAFAKPPAGAASGIIAGDADNDGDADLLVIAAGGPRLFRQEPAGRFVDAGQDAGLPPWRNAPQSAAWLDADHDGDLDLVIAGTNDGGAPAVQLLRNSGEGRFTDITAASALAAARPIVALIPTDFDNRRDIDILAVTSSGTPILFRNLRDGTFRDVAGEAGIAVDGELSAAAIADINKDTYPDYFLARHGRAGTLAVSDGRGRFVMTPAPGEAAGALAAQFVDYDNDGLVDLLTVLPEGTRVLRNLGAKWQDATGRALRALGRGEAMKASPPSPAGHAAALATGDLDGDGDVDAIVRGSSGLAVWRNEGSRSSSLRVRLVPRVSNRSAVGTKIEVRAGSLRHRIETYSAAPAPAPADVVFGLGDRRGADVARVLWPSGILQAETASAAAPGAAPSDGPRLSGLVRIEELDRKPSSCPYLYTWNGERFEFVTDFLGGGEMGYWLAPGVRNSPDPDEYIRIDGRALRPRDGRYEVRVTNELEEAVFLDRAQLIAVAHPADVTVHPNEGLRSTRDPFRLYAIRNVRAPVAVADDHGHDVLDLVARVDRRYPDDYRLERVRGYAAEHSLTITLPAGSDARRALLLTGWTDYAFSGDNVAAHQLGLRMVPPLLQVEDASGQWRTAVPEIGFPVGRPQTVVVDLSSSVPAAARRVRIVTTMRIYWDRIEVGEVDAGAKPQMRRLDPVASELRWRGFSALESPDGREPYDFNYARVSSLSPWKLLPGRYTREGDVRELVTSVDDRYVISRPGDEIALSFDAGGVPTLPEGWTHTFLLYADGFSKEMDLNSASPDELEPLPFHGMSRYPYPPSEAPPWTARHREYMERYNTRIVKRTLPPIELSAVSQGPAKAGHYDR